MKKSSIMVCAQLMAQSIEQLVSQMHNAKSQGADLVEIRLDLIQNFNPPRDLKTIFTNKPLPVIVICRPMRDGGLYDGDESTRLEALFLASELGADFVEFDLEAASKIMAEEKINQDRKNRIIVSFYENGPTPSEEEMSRIVETMKSTGADIVKLVINASDITELPRLFNLLSNTQIPLIAYSSGERGLISQILSPKYGGFLVYGLIEGETVPGLPSLIHLNEAYKVKCINEETKVLGLISKPVGHSKGPLLHNPTFRHANFKGVYVPMYVDDLEKFFAVYPSNDFIGFSVGIPYKEAVIGFCNEVHPLAQSISAANTIIRRPGDGNLVGYNTDCEAAITAIEDAMTKECVYGEVNSMSPLYDKMFVLVGAGGAGRALAFGAKVRGAKIIVFDIDYERAKSLANAVNGEVRRFEDLSNFQPEKGAILANATPIGMHPNTDRISVSEASLGDYQVVFDSVYTPRKTRLLKEAEVAGAIVVSGVEMFLRQAVGQFNLFTGGLAPVEFMRDIIWEKF